MKLVLWLIVAANCHFNGSSVEERVGRAATDPVVSFNKLNLWENKRRRHICGQLIDDPYPLYIHLLPSAAAAPWLVKVEKPKTGEYTTMVVISRRHILADRHALRHLNMTRLFGDYTNKPAQVLSSSLEENDMEVSGMYCEKNDWNNCTEIKWSAHPSKVIIDNSRNPEIVLFAFDDYIPMTPVCLPYMKLTKGDEVLIQNFTFGSLDRKKYYKLFDVRPNGLAIHKAEDKPEPASHVLVKRELGKRFAIVGNSDRWEGDLQLFSSVFPLTERICKWTGACPSLPHVDFKRISKEENEDRLRACGRRTEAPKLSDAVKLALEAPWLVHVKRSDGEVHYEGIVISQRHIITHADTLTFPSSTNLYGYDAMKSGIYSLSTEIPLIDEFGESLTYKMNISVCADDKCQSRNNMTLTPERIMIVFGNYVLLEMDVGMGVLPACLPADFHRHHLEYANVVTANGSTIFSWAFDNEEGTIFKFREEFLPYASERFPETLVSDRNFVFTVYGMNKDKDRKYTEKVTFRYWNEEHERICMATGICAPTMLPVRLKDHETQRKKEHHSTCGVVRRSYIGLNDAPWLVGIRQKKNSSSPVIHTGVLISRYHVLIPGSMFEREEDLFELLGADFKNQQPRQMSVDLPEYDLKEIKFNFEVLMRQCADRQDYQCRSTTEKVLKPSRLLLSDSSDPSVFALEFDDWLPDVPICLEDRKEVEDGDELFIQQYTDPEASVLTVTNASILTRMEPFQRKSGILVRKDGGRTVLVGNLPLGESKMVSVSKLEFCSRITKWNFLQLVHVHLRTPIQNLPTDWSVSSKIFPNPNAETQRARRHGEIKNVWNSQPLPQPIGKRALYRPGCSVDCRSPRDRNTSSHGTLNLATHVFFDEFILTDIDSDTDFPYVGFNSSLPIPRTNFQFRVRMRVCEDAECNTSKEIEVIPTKLFRTSPATFLLEFDQDLPVTPICVPDFELKIGDTLFVQDYMDPTSLFDNTTVSDISGHDSLVTNVTAKVYSYSRVSVIQIDGRFTAVGFKVLDEKGFHPTKTHFRVIASYQDKTCEAIGVCATVKRPTREAPQTTIRKNRIQPEQRVELKEKSDDGRLVSWM